MSLENLLKIGQLKEHPPDSAEMSACFGGTSKSSGCQRPANQPGDAFRCGLQGDHAGRASRLMMHGYRPDTKKPGHHMTVLQTTPLTIGLS